MLAHKLALQMTVVISESKIQVESQRAPGWIKVGMQLGQIPKHRIHMRIVRVWWTMREIPIFP